MNPVDPLCQRIARWAIFAALLVLAGCNVAPLRPPAPEQWDAVRDGSQTLVLMRLDCGEHAVQADPMGLYASQLPSLPSLEVVLGDPGSGGLAKWAESRTDFRVLSDAAQAAGWIALIKPPGTYTLYFVPLPYGAAWNRQRMQPGQEPLLGFERAADPVDGRGVAQRGLAYESTAADRRPRPMLRIPLPKPTLRIAVPMGVRVLYAGSAHLDCLTWAGRAAASVTDESPAARTLTARDLPSLPAPITRLAVPHTGPFSLDIPP